MSYFEGLTNNDTVCVFCDLNRFFYFNFTPLLETWNCRRTSKLAICLAFTNFSQPVFFLGSQICTCHSLRLGCVSVIINR